MLTLITIIHVFAAAVLILSILLQSGKGGGMGSAFGGASQTFFGGHGAGGFLAKLTTTVAVSFMLTSLWLSILSGSPDSVVGVKGKPTKPAASASMSGGDGASDSTPGTADATSE